MWWYRLRTAVFGAFSVFFVWMIADEIINSEEPRYVSLAFEVGFYAFMAVSMVIMAAMSEYMGKHQRA